ncbi:hypothetical protein HOK51_10210 [Candidatus Woesearchaeota archaeon]|jgi:hypothetical protein|nr:hypothetical protein [Candidatus Woesearchaeota archaeon]MBT6520198.1 hypothetical protein [Candidatus Woesearchaeota archaeon]MBT7367866.1 hypothetical protein [Candidatus Woesearchaeota archaeon]
MESIKLNKKFYSKEKIKKVIEQFKNHAKLELIEEKSHFLIKLDEKDSNMTILKEFVNQCI